MGPEKAKNGVIACQQRRLLYSHGTSHLRWNIYIMDAAAVAAANAERVQCHFPHSLTDIRRQEASVLRYEE